MEMDKQKQVFSKLLFCVNLATLLFEIYDMNITFLNLHIDLIQDKKSFPWNFIHQKV
jgi:hypothetical protein